MNSRGVLILAVFCIWFPFCHAQAAEKNSVGQSCSSDQNSFDWDTGWQCQSGALQHGPLFVGSASAYTCNSTNAGVIQWTGSAFQGCNGSGWGSLAVAGATFAAGTVSAPGLAVTTDTSTGLFQATTGTLSVAAEGVAAVRFLTTTSGVDYLTFAPGAAGTPGVVTIGAGGSDTNINIALTPKGTGNVGVGTTSPQAILDVIGPTSGNVFIVRDSTSGDSGLVVKPKATGTGVELQGTNQQLTAVANLDLNPEGGDVGIGMAAPANELDVNGAMAIGTYAGTAAPSNGLIVSGLVGIGTTSPQAILDVIGPTSGNVFIVRDSTSGDSGLVVKPKATGTGVELQGTNQQLTAVANLDLNPEGGNVGIGTTSPSDTLDVNGALGLTTTTATLPTNGIYSPSANALALTTSGATALTVTSTQSVGIGTTAPGGNLVVQPPSNNSNTFQVIDQNGNNLLQVASSLGSNSLPPTVLISRPASDGYGLGLEINNGATSSQAYAKFTNGTTGRGLFSAGILFGMDVDESAVFWNYSNTPFRISTNNSERMRILGGGTRPVAKVGLNVC